MTATTVRAEVAKQETGPVAIIHAEQARIAPVLPDHIDVKQFIGLAEGALHRDPKLMEAAANNIRALMTALMRCAALGHQPGTEEFYLIPRRNKKNANRPEIQGIEGYRGIVERMYRSGAVASVIVREVCEKDRFEFVEGVHDKPQHVVDWFGGSRGDMIGVYAYAMLTTGAVSRVVVLNKADVMAAKAKSDGAAGEFSPWQTNERAMWWKTAARRLEPWVPTSAEYRREQLRAASQAGVYRSTFKAPDTPGMVSVDTMTGEVLDADVVEDSPLKATQEERSETEGT